MKTMNGITNELWGRKANKNWRIRCGATMLAVFATLYGSNLALGQAFLQTPGNWGANIAIDTVQTQNRVAPQGNNIGFPQGYNLERQAGDPTGLARWSNANTTMNPYGLDLYDVLVGNVEVYRLDSNPATPVRIANYTFTTGDAFVSNGETFTVTGPTTWAGSFNASGSTFNTQGNTLTVTGAFSNTSTFTINAGSPNSFGWLDLSRGTNAGVITVGSSGLRLSSNNFSNANGRIQITSSGILSLANGYSLSGDVHGDGPNTARTRGLLNLEGNARYTNGNWSGDVTVSGQASVFSFNALDARGVTANGLDTLRVINGADVVISSPDQVSSAGNPATIVLGNYGSISKHLDTGVLTLSNEIVFDNFNHTGQGNFNVIGLTSTRYSADTIADAGQRIILDGIIRSALTYNKTFNVNAGGTGYGAVSLQGDLSNYHGDYYVHQGTLEAAGGSVSQLGAHGDPTQGRDYQIGIGDGAFRVINVLDQTVSRFISLDSEFSTYEVFTGDITNVNANAGARSAMVDAQRLTVFQTGAIYGNGSLNKDGDGRLVLAAAINGYTGDTIIHHGILSISSNQQINDNDRTKSIIIGSVDNDFDNWRPVFETTTHADPTKYDQAGIVSIDNARVQINQRNSVVRTTGKNNETIFNTEVYSVVPNAMTAPPVLNKEGAGTLTLNGKGNWGYERSGETVIKQGTVQINNKDNIAKGDITIGVSLQDFPNWEGLAADYEAVLKLAANAGYQNLPNNIKLGSVDDAYIEVGHNSTLGVNQVSQAGTAASNLNKKGLGELILHGAAAYAGWTNIEEGSITLTLENQIVASAGVDLVGNNTTLKLDGANQMINNLRGIDPQQAALSPSEWNPSLWTRTVDIGNRKLTVQTGLTNAEGNLRYPIGSLTVSNMLFGNIVSNGGTLAMEGKTASDTLAAGFIGFNGDFQINSGNIMTLTDTTLTGLSGKVGTMLDIFGNTLTVDIGNNCQYDGTIVSRYPVNTQNPRPSDYGELIKKGTGTLTTNFQATTGGQPIPGQSFNGSVTLEGGSIVSNSNFSMAAGNTMKFFVHTNPDGSVDPLVFDISKHVANFGAPTNLEVVVDDPTVGWNLPNVSKTVGQIRGNEQSDYSGLRPMDFNSLFYTLDTQDVTSLGRHDLNVIMNVTGLNGVGGTFNQASVGDNLDGIRVTNLTGNPELADIVKGLWTLGNNLQTPEERFAARSKIQRVFDELSGDVIANATFMGLDSPWKQPFDRLNLDSQMVYVQPQQRAYRGQAVANMRNLWFTPTYQGVVARSDGNARGFKIERPGYKLGWDKRVAQNASVGFLLGYSSPSLHQKADIINASDFQFGIYGGAMVGYYVEVKGYIGFGHQNFKSTRTADLGLLGKPSQTAHATFDGDTFNFSLEVARPLFLGFAVLRPTMGIDSEHAYRYAFTEKGDAVAMHFGRSAISRTRARFALALETCTLERTIFSGRLGYSALLGGRDYADVTAQFVNAYAPASDIRSVAVGKSYFDAGVGCRYFMNQSKTLSLIGDYDASVSHRWAEHRGVVGFQFIY